MAGPETNKNMIVANWKTYMDIPKAQEWMSIVGEQVSPDGVMIVICPDYITLPVVKGAIAANNYQFLVGVQDVSPYGEGAYTGEVPAKSLSGSASWAIVGHSERRKLFGETDEMIAEKVNQANESNITPIVCVPGSDTPIPPGCNWVAYEPLFAIGTGNPDTPENANQVAKTLKEKYSDRPLGVLYGGSVTSKNVKSYLDHPYLDGVLVGKASSDQDEFIKIVKASQEKI